MSSSFVTRTVRSLLWWLLVPAAVSFDAGAAEPGRLSLMKDAEFSQWLTGTEWEIAPDQGKRRYWFLAPGYVVYQRMGDEGWKSQSYFPVTTQKKGVLKMFHDNDTGRPFEFTVNEELKTAAVKDVKANSIHIARQLDRRARSAPPMKKEEFQSWLIGKTLDFQALKILFDSRDQVTVKWDRTVREKWEVIEPGLLRYYSDPAKGSLVMISADLKTAQYWNFPGTMKGKVMTSAPPPAAQTTARPAAKGGVVTMNDLKAVALTSRASAVNALLVQELGHSRFAGKASSLSLSALPLEGDKPATIAFNQNVGSMMQKALQEVARFHALRHGGWPRAHEIQLSFEDKFGGKDGPSAAVACALLLESVIKGTALDPEFAVTGDLNADGSVQPIGGVHAKLRGATNLKCKILGIPSKNGIHATDLVLTEGLKPFTAIQVFSLAKFDDALAVARADKSPELTAAINDFAVLSRSAAAAPNVLRAPDAIAKLKSILQRAPGHLSAQILLQYATDKLPRSLSPAGTLSELDQSIGDLNTAISGDLAATNKLDGGQIAKARTALQRLRPLADARVRPLVDAWVNWGNIADKLAHAGGPANEQSVKEWRSAISRVSVEDEKLRSNESFLEALK